MPFMIFQRSILLAVIPSSLFILAINRWLSPKAYSLGPRDTCNGFTANSDLYGLGIRIGVYLQWISSLLTNILVPAGISDSLDTNSTFLFAVFIAVANATRSSDGLSSAKAFIMLQMCFGYLLSVLSVSGLRVTLLSDPRHLRPDLWLDKLQKSPKVITTRSVDLKRLKDLSKPSFPRPPEGVIIPPTQLTLLRALNIWADFSVVSGVMAVSFTRPSGRSSRPFGL